MSEPKTAPRRGLNFEALRRAIERGDPDSLLGFYAEDAGVRIVNGEAPQNPPFKLCGRAQIYRYLQAVFGQKTSHRIQREAVGEECVIFEEAREYPDGSRILVATTLEVRDGEIFRQVDVVAREAHPPHRLDGRRFATEAGSPEKNATEGGGELRM